MIEKFFFIFFCVCCASAELKSRELSDSGNLCNSLDEQFEDYVLVMTIGCWKYSFVL